MLSSAISLSRRYFETKTLIFSFSYDLIELKESRKQWLSEKNALLKVFKKVLEEKKRLDKNNIDYSTVNKIFFESNNYQFLTKLLSDKDADYVMESEMSESELSESEPVPVKRKRGPLYEIKGF